MVFRIFLYGMGCGCFSRISDVFNWWKFGASHNWWLFPQNLYMFQKMVAYVPKLVKDFPKVGSGFSVASIWGKHTLARSTSEWDNRIQDGLWRVIFHVGSCLMSLSHGGWCWSVSICDKNHHQNIKKKNKFSMVFRFQLIPFHYNFYILIGPDRHIHQPQ